MAAAWYAARLALELGLDPLPYWAAGLLHDAAKPAARLRGAGEEELAGRVAWEILVELGHRGLAERVRAILEGRDPWWTVVRDADTLAKLGFLGFAETVAKWASRGLGSLDAVLSGAARQLTALHSLDQLICTEPGRRLAHSLAPRLREALRGALEELKGLGVEVAEAEAGGIVLLVPGRCPRCGAPLETRVEESMSPGCSGVRVSARCSACSWSLGYTVCPPRPCRERTGPTGCEPEARMDANQG